MAAIDDSADITRLAGPLLEALAKTTGETAQLYLPHGDEVLLVEIAESPHVLRAGPRKGQRIPLHCGAGAKAVFAFQAKISSCCLSPKPVRSNRPITIEL